MSLFPAYQGKEECSDKSSASQVHTEGSHKAPNWLKNTSYKSFEHSLESSSVLRWKKTSPNLSPRSSSRSSSRSQSQSRRCKDSESSDDDRSRRQSRPRSEDRGQRSKKSRSKPQKRSPSRSKKKKKQRSSSRSRSRSQKRRRRSKSSTPDERYRSRDDKSRRKRRSRSRSMTRKKKKSKSEKKAKVKKERLSGSPDFGPAFHDPDLHPEQIVAASKEFARKVFTEEVGVAQAHAFRLDTKADRTLLAGQGTYTGDVAMYKNRIKRPLGAVRKPIKESGVISRFYQKPFVKQFLKYKDVVGIDKEKVRRDKEELEGDLRRSVLRFEWSGCLDPAVLKDDGKNSSRQLGDSLNDVYDSKTEEYFKGVGGLDFENTDGSKSGSSTFENLDIVKKRQEYNAALRKEPSNVELWIEFIDFQDEALKETIFELESDASIQISKKKRGEVMRAQAQLERKLAICKTAIEKNPRSIDLAVKRLELSRDLLDAKTLDQQWRELIFVYPNDVDLWKRYLMFVQTFYIRFSVGDTLKAFRSCLMKLKQVHQSYTEEGNAKKTFQVEHGIVDILAQLGNLLVQSGHTEKAIALFQGLLELNLFSPDFPAPGGFDPDDKINMMLPIFERCKRVGERDAPGWGAYATGARTPGADSGTMDPIRTSEKALSEWEDNLLADVVELKEEEIELRKGDLWVQIESEREKKLWAPWRPSRRSELSEKGGQSDDEEDDDDGPDDPERKVDFNSIAGLLIELHHPETRFRLILSLLSIFGVTPPDHQFSPLVNSAAARRYGQLDALLTQEFHIQLGDSDPVGHTNLLSSISPSFRKDESLAIFLHSVLMQSYNKFEEPFRTKIILIWLDFEAEMVRINRNNSAVAKELKKDLKKLIKSLLKEDRNNLELVVKYADLEYHSLNIDNGYRTAYSILDAAIQASNSLFFKKGSGEDSFSSATLLYRAAVELELKEIVRLEEEHRRAVDDCVDRQQTENKPVKDDSLHRNRLQWLLVHIGCGKKYSSYSPEKSGLILDLIPGALNSFQSWISEDLDNISSSQIFKSAPFIRHPVADVTFFYTWLVKLTSGTRDAVAMVNGYRDLIAASFEVKSIDKLDRFDEEALTRSFLVESLDKICFDMLQFDSLFDIVEKQHLRKFYKYCLSYHYTSRYFQSKLFVVEDTTSIMSPIWQEILLSISDKKKANLALIEESCSISLNKFLSVLDATRPQDITPLGYGFLNRLSNQLERCVSRPQLRHSPLIWRLLLWTHSLLCLRLESSTACENIKVMLYRAVQDVPWCKALYLDTALYLQRIGELTTTKQQLVQDSDDEGADNQPQYKDIPGTLQHISELMLEKEVRIRLPLQELDVLLQPME